MDLDPNFMLQVDAKKCWKPSTENLKEIAKGKRQNRYIMRDISTLFLTRSRSSVSVCGVDTDASTAFILLYTQQTV
jgi:hypothetical protein